ncbi:hypothetical protein EON83_02010 [bacterium]|nr:MAG: hypothetical protein EON83_02010 [bacterium]
MQTPYPPPVAPKKKTAMWLALGCGLPFGLLVLFIIAVALMPSTSSTKVQTGKAAQGTAAPVNIARYAGKWKGTDGISLWIRGDGKGDFDAGSTNVSGGGVTIDEQAKTLSITSFFGIGKTWKIDKAPKSADSAEMTLDGIVYSREGAAGDSEEDTETGNSKAISLSPVPSAAECDSLARATLTDFDNALATRDFKPFYQASAKVWKAQTNPTELKTAFKTFIDKGIRIGRVIREATPTYQKPRVRQTNFSPDGMLELAGSYPTKPYKTSFEISYLKDNGVWRPASFNISIK